MKFIKGFFKGLLGLILLLILLAYLTDYDYILKGVRVVYMTGHTTAYIDDYPHFENMELPASNQPQPWPQHKEYNRVQPTDKLKAYNDQLGTVAFLILKNDSVWYENYAPEYGVNSQTNSFSMAKSIVSAMLGKAIQEGHIQSLDQTIGDFFEQYASAKTTVGDLSSMASGLDWIEHYTSPFSITARSYYDDDLAETMLGLSITETPGERFKYLSGSTQLLGMVIEKATGKKMADYAAQSFWQPMGFEKPALWQVDDEDNKLAKAYCCISSNARDFARFGKLYKDHGKWNGKKILDSSFVATSIRPRFKDGQEYGYGFWLSDHLDKDIFVMRGILGQYVITIPEDDVIIVRLGHNKGPNDGRDFSTDFYTYVEEAYKMISSNP
jgi:CubicO group peptidase (beta-lactamase class C family)